MPLLAVKTRRLVLYVASLIRICRVLSGSLGPTRCTRSISSTVNGGRSVELTTRSVSCKTSSPSRSGIPEILREFLLEYCSRSSALSSRSCTFVVRSKICLSFAIMIVRSSATSCRSSSTSSSFNFLATFGSQRASKRSEVKFVVDAVDAPLDRLIALFGFDGDRCRVLCLAGTQAWRDRRRGTGDNILILCHVQMFLLSNTTNAFLIRKKLAKSPYYNITATVSMFHLSVKTTSCQTYLLLRTTPLVTVTHTWSRDDNHVAL